VIWEIGDIERLIEIAGYLHIRRAPNGAVRCAKLHNGNWLPVHYDSTDEQLIALTGIDWHQSVYLCPQPKEA